MIHIHQSLSDEYQIDWCNTLTSHYTCTKTNNSTPKPNGLSSACALNRLFPHLLHVYLNTCACGDPILLQSYKRKNALVGWLTVFFFCRCVLVHERALQQARSRARLLEKNVCQLIYTSLSLCAPSTQSLSRTEWTGGDGWGSSEHLHSVRAWTSTDGPLRAYHFRPEFYNENPFFEREWTHWISSITGSCFVWRKSRCWNEACGGEWTLCENIKKYRVSTTCCTQTCLYLLYPGRQQQKTFACKSGHCFD